VERRPHRHLAATPGAGLRAHAVGLVAVAVVLGACAADEPATERAMPPSTTTASTSPPTTTTTTTVAPVEPTVPGPVVMGIRLERWSQDGTEGFEELVQDTLLDPRGWTQAGFEFRFGEDAPYRVLVAEGDVVDGTCAPYTTGGEYSCQIGPTVALNAERWREATPTWTGTLDDYRRMLVNHEVGHLLGRHHARPACTDGGPAAVMFQQSAGLDGCQPNPWPLPWEIACAARDDEPIAPPYEPDATATCGPTNRGRGQGPATVGGPFRGARALARRRVPRPGTVHLHHPGARRRLRRAPAVVPARPGRMGRGRQRGSSTHPGIGGG